MCLIVSKEQPEKLPKVGYKVVIRDEQGQAHSVCGAAPGFTAGPYAAKKRMTCTHPQGFHCFLYRVTAENFMRLAEQRRVAVAAGKSWRFGSELSRFTDKAKYALIRVRAHGDIKVGRNSTGGAPHWDYADKKPGFTCSKMYWAGKFLKVAE